MTRPEYVEFLGDALGNATRVSRDDAVHFVCCDWRHVTEIMEAGRLAYCETLNVVVWVKSNAGQGSFYRSQHEFVVVFRAGEAAHLNNVELGRHGRSRSNVWNYRGVTTFGAGRMEELRSHPTVKPVALVADAMRDCTRRRDICLDTFSGSWTTITRSEALRRAPATTPFRCGLPRYGCRLGEKAQPTTAIASKCRESLRKCSEAQIVTEPKAVISQLLA
jgi:DNA methylase